MQRRSFLTALGASPALVWSFQGLALASTLRLIVSDLSVHRIKVNHRGNWLIVVLRTSNGLTGMGDASQWGEVRAALRA